MAKRTLKGTRPRGTTVSAAAAAGPVVETASVYQQMAESVRLRRIPVSAIAPNPNQPRKRFDRERLEALAASIEERGLLQPIVVRALTLDQDRFELIAGERRWRAHQLNGAETIDAILREADTAQSALDALAENELREDLDPIEQARAYSTVIEDLGISQEALSKRLGIGRPTIGNSLRLLDLPDIALDLLSSGELTKRHGLALLKEPDHTRRAQLARRAAQEDWSVRTLEQATSAAANKATRPTASADHRATADQYAEQISTKSGHEVKLAPRGAGGFRLTIDFDDTEGIDAFIAEALKQRRR